MSSPLSVFQRNLATQGRMWFLLFALLLALPAFAQQQKPKPKEDDSRALRQPEAVRVLPTSGKRFALIVGVDKYADTQISTLGGASNDARALRDALVRYAGFPADQVTLLASDQPEERQPTRGNILRRLSNLAAIVPPDGLILFSFAGHGMERQSQAFLLPSDAQVSNDIDLLEQTAINVNTVKDRIKKTNVSQVLMILDACRNDPAGRANADNPLTPAYTRGFSFDVRNREVKAFATLYATEVGKRAYEYKEKKQGYFTWALVEALKGGAANDKKEITLGGLVRYLQERVPKRILQDLGPGRDQKPFAIVEGYKADELVVAITGNTPTMTETSVEPTPVAVAPVEDDKKNSRSGPASLEGTIWTVMDVNSGLVTIEFLKDGKYKYTIRTGSVGGSWQQSGNFVQMAPSNGYSTLEGTFDGNLMKLEGRNQEGAKWNWTMLKKEKKD